MKLFSPAKLNLFFRVLGKRPDGYHDIASLFQAIDLGDTLHFKLRENRDLLFCSDLSVPSDGSNLILRAAELFRKKTGHSFGIEVKLEKKIPVQSGLGGGSSNAATTLWALNALTGSSIAEKDLMNWGAEIGSDVPFFFSAGTAYCTGRGELVENLDPLPDLKGWVAKPPYGLSTPAVYQKCVPLAPDAKPFFNDLEHAAFTLLPQLAEIKATLYEMGFDQVTMTGSGTAFFCIGNVPNPQMPGINFTAVRAIRRTGWYEFPA